jgi:type I restriction enzyme R subunit
VLERLRKRINDEIRARLRTRIKHLLRKHGDPPDQCEAAMLTVIAQAEHLCADWAESRAA